MGTHNRCVKNLLEIPNRFGKIVCKPLGRGDFLNSHCRCNALYKLILPTCRVGDEMPSSTFDREVMRLGFLEGKNAWRITYVNSKFR